MSPLITFTGPAGVGKSTLADAVRRHIDRPLARWSFADPLRAAALAIFGSEYRTQAEKRDPDPFWSERLGERFSTGRRILQTLGTEVCRAGISPEVWLYALERRLTALPATTVVLLDDARFPNETAWVRAHGGLVCHLHRAGIAYSQAHASERPLPVEPGDWVLDLDGPAAAAAALRIAYHLATAPKV